MKKIIKQIPFAKQVYRYIKETQYKRQFVNDCYGCFYGVFETFEQAKQVAPKTKSIGYDNAELAQEYQQMLEDNNWENSGRLVASYDYPVLFWLNSIFNNEGVNTIFDFGGNVGIHFYNYAKYLVYPKDLQWTVCDMPAIVKAGREIADKRSVKNLDFVIDFKDIRSQEIFISSGAIQYVENLAKMLLPYHKPKHLLINRLPLYNNGKQFVTLQNGGKVFYPQYVFNKTEFIESLNNIGYELIDIWEDSQDSCIIPLYPEKSVYFYYGLYLKLKA
jgi:putative methyltransferase (TIGR04325 family)